MTTREAYSIFEPVFSLLDKGVVQPLTLEKVETNRCVFNFVHEINTL